MFSHAIFTPGQPGWLEKVDAALELKPESMKGYTIGDNTHKDISRYPWRMDDEKVAYLGYEKFVKAGIKNVCVHKGLFAPAVEHQFPNLRGFVDVSDVGQAAKDWPQLNFVIYHGAYRHVGGDPKVALAEFDRTGRISWTSDLADIPAQYNVTNVYADVGQLFAMTLIAEPRVTAALMGTMVKRHGRRSCLLGHRRGVDRIAAMADRRPAPPRDPRRHAEAIWLRAARSRDGPVKTAIFGGNNAKLYGVEPKKAELDFKNDKLTDMKARYDKAGREPNNLRYGYVAEPIADFSVFG